MTTARDEPHAVERLMRLLSTRMSWTAGAALLTSAGLHVSRGWAESISAFRGGVFAPEALEVAERILESAFVLHSYVGNKQVTWFDMRQWDARAATAVRRWAENLDPGNPPRALNLRRWIPASVPYQQDALTGRRGAPPVLVEVSKQARRLYFQFFAVRTYALREPIDLSGLPTHEREYFEGYQEVIGVKRQHFPCFDCCVLDLEANRLELRVDFNPGHASEDQAGAVPALVHQLNRILMAEVQHTPAGLGLVNFFPAVERIYRDQEAGKVAMLGFVATSSDTTSNNSGRTLRKPNQDLRRDRFHLGGKGNVDALSPYSIGAKWPPQGGGKEALQIELNGSVRMIYLPNPVISVANFIGCATTTDYDFLTEELSRHLRPR